MSLALDVWREAGTLLGPNAPPFVRGADSPNGWLPVFCFHTLVPDVFERQLSHLARNGYRTVSLDEVVRWMNGDGALPDRAVALTIDDGRRSTFSVGLPLLERYDAVATAFVIPGLLEEGPPRATLDDVRARGASAENVVASERADAATVLRWSEVERLHASGRVAIESHTWLHRRVGVAPRVVELLSSQSVRAGRYEIPLAPEDAIGWTDERIARERGWPLLQSRSLLIAERAFVVPDDECERLRASVRQKADAWLASPRAWRQALRPEIARCEAAARPVDVEVGQRAELERARQALEERLPGKRVSHLCLPRGDGDERVRRLAVETGHRSVSWGALPVASTNRRGADPLRLARIKGDFVERLPGAGRVSLSRVLARKIARRLRGETGW